MVAAPHCPLQDNCSLTLTADRFPFRGFESVGGLQEGEIWSGAAVINNLLYPWYILHVYLLLAVCSWFSVLLWESGGRRGVTNSIHEVSRHICIANCVRVTQRWASGKQKENDDEVVCAMRWVTFNLFKSVRLYQVLWRGERTVKGQAGISMRRGDWLPAAFHLIGSAGFLTVRRQRGSGRAHGIKNGESQWGGDALWLHKHHGRFPDPGKKKLMGNCKEKVPVVKLVADCTQVVMQAICWKDTTTRRFALYMIYFLLAK